MADILSRSRGVAEQYVDAAFGVVGITSGDRYYAWLREHEMGVTRAVAREVWGEYRTSGQWIDTLARLPETTTIPRGWYSSTSSQYVDKFGYKYQVKYREVDTDLDLETTYFLPSTRPMSRQEMEGMITERIEAGTGDVKGTVTGMAFTSFWHRAGAGW